MVESIRFIMQTCPDFYLPTNDRLSNPYWPISCSMIKWINDCL